MYSVGQCGVIFFHFDFVKLCLMFTRCISL